MKAFSIMAVVLNHTQIMPEIKTAVYLVCLPAFFFVAGLFTDTRLTPGEFFRKKTLRLLIPYLVFGLLSWLPWLVIGRRYGADADAGQAWWLPLAGMACGKSEMMVHNRPLWFLCCMISLEWLYYAISRFSRRAVRRVLIVAFAAGGCALSYAGLNLPWEISAAFIILPLYALAAEHKDFFKTRIPAVRTYVWLLLLAGALGGITLGYVFNGDIGLHKTSIGNPAWYYLTVLSVVGLWLSVSVLLNKGTGTVPVLQYIGRNTLIILCTHIPLFGAVKGVCMLCRVPLAFFETNAGSVTLWLSSLLVLLPVIYCINRYLPFLIGKRRTTLE